jgi:4a-hydroxytetrahydrobiopterin dehydratase
MEVTLYTRRNCPLCDKAKAVLREAGVAPREVDIDTDRDLKRQYSDDVPVIFIDGAEAFRHKVTLDQIRVAVNGWRIVDGHLEKQFKFADFAKALAFTNQIGAIAEELNHHPDITLGWGKVQVVTWSHDANAITARDYRLAARIDALDKPAIA